MTSTVNSCKRSIKELEGEIRTLKAENEDLNQVILENKKLLTVLADIVSLLRSLEGNLLFRLPPVSTFIEKLYEILRDAND